MNEVYNITHKIDLYENNLQFAHIT